ncbi:enoyl-(Acyl carrier) reductase family protein, partial [Chlamydia psittaci C1/97]
QEKLLDLSKKWSITI